jgi:hypothetical protein
MSLGWIECGGLPLATICAGILGGIRFKFSAVANLCSVARNVPQNGLTMTNSRHAVGGTISRAICRSEAWMVKRRRAISPPTRTSDLSAQRWQPVRKGPIVGR